MLLQVESSLRDLIQDDALTDACITEATTFEVPTSYSQVLWELLTDKARDRFSESNPYNLITNDKDDEK